MMIQLLRADVASLKLDAIVAASDRDATGAEGRAVVTGGNLLARFVIHVQIASAGEPDADERLRDATRTALERGEELAVASIGLPAIATGEFGFTPERCARVMIAEAIAHRPRARSLQRAVFCLFGRQEYDAFETVLKELDH